jgi:preprotein translocase subunit SecD
MKSRNRLSLAVVLAVAFIGLIATLLAGLRPGLGLDLQGGASVLMKPVGEVREGALEKARSIIEQRVNGQGIGEAEVRLEGDRILVEVPGVKNPEAVLNLVGQTAELRFRPVIQALGTDFDPFATTVPATTTVGASTTAAGASTATPSTTVAGASTTKPATPTTIADLGGPGFAVSAQESADTTIADTTIADTTAAGTTAAGTTAATTTGVAKTVPPVSVNAGAGQTVVIGGNTTTIAGSSSSPTSSTVPPSTIAFEDTLDKTTGLTSRASDLASASVLLADNEGNKYLLGPSLATGEIVGDAIAEIDTQTGAWKVRLDMTSSGSAVFDSIAEQTVGRQLAIVLDSTVQSAPSINDTRYGGTAEISGSFSEQEAKDLATVLRYGSLPVQLEQQQVQTVSASLGRDSLRAGIFTGLFGLLLVALYMIFYYRSLGLVVVAGLATSFALLWTLLSLLTKSNGLALSLAGAVGIIVSVGVTVDSYVVYFERLRDELRHGRSMDASIDRGFRRAWRTILAADGVSILGAFVLYVLTVGSVRGFALMLMISTALDMVVAWFFTRPLVALLAPKSFFTTGRFGVASGAFSAAAPVAVAAPSVSGDTIIRPGASGSRSTGVTK